MRADGEIRSLQFIGPEGEKRFLAGGRMVKFYFSIRHVEGVTALCIAEALARGLCHGSQVSGAECDTG